MKDQKKRTGSLKIFSKLFNSIIFSFVGEQFSAIIRAANDIIFNEDLKDIKTMRRKCSSQFSRNTNKIVPSFLLFSSDLESIRQRLRLDSTSLPLPYQTHKIKIP